MKLTKLQKRLIAGGVRNLKQFGYPGVTEENILTDEVYSAFFRPMLEDAKGHGVDEEIDALLSLLPQ